MTLSAEHIDQLARRSAIHEQIDADIHAAEKAVAVTVLPTTDDTRRWIALHEAMGDLDAELARGHRDVDGSLTLIAAMAQAWLEQRAEVDARRPVSAEDWSGR